MPPMGTASTPPRGGVPGTAARTVGRAPLLLPLAAVAGCILSVHGAGGLHGVWCCAWMLIPAACAALALLLKQWRVAAGTLLCAAFSLLYAGMLAEQGAGLRERLCAQGRLELQGRVVREMEHGFIISPAWYCPNVQVRAEHGRLPCSLGDTVAVSGVPSSDRPPLVPGMFDAASWRRGQGIALSMELVDGRFLRHGFSLTDIRRIGLDIRESLARRIMPPGTQDDWRRQVLCAMVLGDKESAEDETMDVFRKGGCLHVFAVSGLHVGLVFAICWKLFFFLRLVRPRVARPLILLLVGVYVLVTGCAVPAMRAFLMLALFMAGLMLRRRASMLNIWCFSALAVLLVSPHRLFDAGFLLSFSVYAGICAGVAFCSRDTPLLHPDPYLPHRLWSKRQRFMSLCEQNARMCVVVSLSAWLVALPVTICYFHTFTPYSVLTNIAITLLLLPLMLFGLLFMLLGGVPYLGALLELCALKCSGALIAVVGFFASLPHAYMAAVQPQPPDAAVLLVRPSGCACMLGNPGMLINCGSSKTASFTTQPALFHSGFRPAWLLVGGKAASLGGGADTMQRLFPGLQVLRYDSLPRGGFSCSGAAGAFRIYPAVEEPNRPDSNRAPIVLWQGPHRRVLYVGNASVDTFLSIPEKERRADAVILGRHPTQPLFEPGLLRATGAGRIILLPDAELPLRPQDVAPQAELVPLHGTQLFRL